MEAHDARNESNGTKTLISFYANYVWNRLAILFPTSGSNFLGKISNLYRRTSRKRRVILPLPLPSYSSDSSVVTTEASRAFDLLEDIMGRIISNLHNIQKNLQFWQSRAEGSNAQKVCFMIFERGPKAFLDGTFLLLRGCIAEGSSVQQLCQFSYGYISERITVLTTLRCSLATFLAQVYMEVDKCGEELVKDPEKSLPQLLVTVNGLFLKLEASIGYLHAMRQSDSTVDGSYSFPLLFEKQPEVKQDGSQWTDCEIRDFINLVYRNLQKLDEFLSHMVAKHHKPRKLTLYWIHYTCGAIGLSFGSIWLLRHSSLMGSPDLDNWIREVKNSTRVFINEHVEQPLLSIRDELFETFRKRHKGVMDIEELQLTSNSLHRMLLAFTEQTRGQKFPENASDQEMLEIVMSRYEKEITHPIQNLLSGELARALLIQVQKLKLDIEMAMLEIDQILRANEINFAILAALPAFFLSFILFMLVRAWFKQDSRAEGRGRVARLQRRLILVEVKKRLMQYEIYVNQGLEKDAQCMLGLVLYSLNRLFHAVEGHAKATGEWQYLRQDIVDLAKPRLQTAYKFEIISTMERIYDCLLPSLKRQ